ncbi:hypothetical protein ACFWVB_02620 [Streptomyces microflavus]|uniref:hypothetical protein n=1 Tax=Streptomyces microflavus TaxID=1919 RepID=UPI00364773F9
MANRTRRFTFAELAEHDVPPDSPEDVLFSQTLIVDEHLRNSKYSQERRAIFRADDDGKTYAVTYEANVDAADYEVGPGPDNHGWHGDTVEATEVMQRALIVAQWVPVTDEPDFGPPKASAIDSLTALWEENGARTSVAREAAAQWIVDHADEIADLYDTYLASGEGAL